MKISQHSFDWMLYATTALCILAALPALAAEPAVTVNYDVLGEAPSTMADPPVGYSNQRPISSPLTPNKPIVLQPLPKWSRSAEVRPVTAQPVPLQIIASTAAPRASIFLQQPQAQDIVRELAAQAPTLPASSAPRTKLTLVPPPPKVPATQMAAVPTPQTQIAVAVVPPPKTQIATATTVPVPAAVPQPRTKIATQVAAPAPVTPEPQRAASLPSPVSTVVQPEIAQRNQNTVAPLPQAVIAETATKPEDFHMAEAAVPVAAMPANSNDGGNDLRAEDVVALDLNNPGGVVVPMMPAVPVTPVTTEGSDGILPPPPQKLAATRHSQFMSSLTNDDDKAPLAPAPHKIVTADAVPAAKPLSVAAEDMPQFTSSLSDGDRLRPRRPSAPREPAVATAYDLPDVKTIKTLEVPAAKTASAIAVAADTPTVPIDDTVMAVDADAAATSVATTPVTDNTTAAAPDVAPPVDTANVEEAAAARPLVPITPPVTHTLQVPAGKQIAAAPAAPVDNDLRNQMAQSDSRLAQAEDKIDKLLAQQTALEAQAATGAAARAAADALQQRLATAEQQTAAQQAELASLREAKDHAIAQAAAPPQAMPEFDALKTQIVASEARMAQAEDELANLRAENAAKNQATTQADAQLNDLKTQVTAVNSRLSQTQAEAAQLRAERDNAQAAVAVAAAEQTTASASVAEVGDLKTQITQMNSRIGQAEADAAQLRAERDEAQAQAQTQAKMLAASAQENASAQPQIAMLEARVNAAENKVSAAESEVANLRNARAATADKMIIAAAAAPPTMVEKPALEDVRNDTAAAALAKSSFKPLVTTDVERLPKIVQTPAVMKFAAAPPTNTVTPAVVSFEPGNNLLNSQLENYLDTVARQAKAQPSGRLTLQAYADGSNQAASGARRLSLQRALTVRDYLNKQGVPVSRMDVKALGAAPDANNPDRVEVLFN